MVLAEDEYIGTRTLKCDKGKVLESKKLGKYRDGDCSFLSFFLMFENLKKSLDIAFVGREIHQIIIHVNISPLLHKTQTKLFTIFPNI